MIRSLAWRSVRARKGRAVLNAAGIVLGVALFFSVLSLSKTIVSTFDELFSSVYGDTDLIIAGDDGAGTVKSELLSKVQSTNGVEEVQAVVFNVMALVVDGKVSKNTADQLYTNGVDPAAPDLAGAEIVDGKSEFSGNDIQLDEGWAAENDLEPGDKVSFATPTGVHDFVISGIFKIGEGLDFGGSGFGVITEELAREVFDVPTGYSEIDIALESGADLETVRADLESFLPEGVEAKTPSDVSDDINAQIQGFNIILYFFAAMSLFVGGFLILNSFNMTVAQRLREIGMMRTLGSSRKIIRRMILIEALLLGILGSLLGIVIGLLLSQLMVKLVSSIGFPVGSVKFSTEAFIIAPILGVTATLFGALRPAVRASRIPPIQAVLTEHRAEALNLKRRLSVGSVMVALGLAGVFVLASATSFPTPVLLAGAFGVIFLFSGVIMLGPIVVPWLVRGLSWPLRKLTPIEGRMAADSAKANPVRTASTASGLMIGIALVAAIGSLGSSFIGSISDDLDKELKNDFSIALSTFGGGGGPQQTISANALDKVLELPETKDATGTKFLFATTGYAKNYSIWSLDPAKHSAFANPEYVDDIPVVEVDKKLAEGEVTVPEPLAKGKKTKVGDTITLEGPRGSKTVRVAALQTGSSLEAQSIVMSDDTWNEIYGIDGFSQILVTAKSPEQRAALEKSLNALVESDYPTFEVLSNEEIKKQIENQINQVFSIFYVIMLVAIIVSLLGVINTLLMNVLERTREIGVIRAIGASRRQVKRLIRFESLLLTTAGSILGLAVGMALGYAFVRGIAASGQEVAFHPPVGAIVLVAILAVIFGVLAALIPARRAAKMNVIEAVSYE